MKTMTRPTVAELVEYAREIGFSGFDPQAFIDHYETVGWVVGKARTPMVSWRAAVRTWQRNAAQWSGQVETQPTAAEEEYARQARERLAAGGYDIGRLWAKVRDAIGQDGLRRVQAMARRGE